MKKFFNLPVFSGNLHISILLLTVLLAVTTLTSCQNFLKGDEVKQEILDYIAYCNAKECTLYISQDSSTGVFLSSAKQKCRVGYTTELQVTVNTANYVFMTLNAVSINDLNISREDFVEYKTEVIDEDKGIYKITIKLLKEAHDILICPVCSLIPKITGVTPAIETSGCEQDLEIKVSFNKAMDRESFADFSCLKITSDGEDLTSLFATPFFTSDGTTLVITPLCASQSEDFSSSFLLEPSGTVNTRKITVEFNFTGDQKDKEGIPISGYSEYTYKVNKNLSQNELPSMKVEITGDSGDFTPTIGIKDCIKTYTYQLSFRPYDDYEFIRWEIFNKTNGTAIQNGSYITIENPNDRNTTFTFATLPEDDSVKVAVRPMVVERPEIFSYSPQQSSNNTYKDSMIQFIFDNDMDPSSIYYSKEEIQTINAYYNIDYANFLPAVDPAELADGATLQNHYGYKQGSGDDEEYIYKNISITLQGSGKNVNKCFDAPVLEGKRVVTIPSSKIEELPNYAVVQVSINKNFCFIKDGIPVVMKKSKNWTYQVSKEKDGTGPVVSYDSDIKVSFSGANGKEITKGTCPAIPWQTGNNQIYNNEQKLRLELKIHDEGIGPADMFTLKLEKVMDNNYTASSVDYEKSFRFHSVSITTNNATFEDSEVDFSDLHLADGVYKTSFIFRDKSGNPLEYPAKDPNTQIAPGYYFTVDNAIEMAAPTITDTTDSSGLKFRLDWDPPLDCVETIIRCKKNGTQIYSHTFTNTNQHTQEYSLPDLDTNYSFEISNKDMLGHTQSLTVSEKSASFDRIIVSGTPEKTFYCSGETFDKTGLTVTAYLSKNKSWQTTNYSTDLGTAINMYGKTVNVSYTYSGVTKTAAVQNSTYYVVASDALTQSPVQITGHSNPIYATYLGPQTYYKFGDYPQTIAADNITFSSAPVYNGWYLGSDGYLYEKCIENLCAYYSPEHNYDESYGYVYSNGQRVKWEFENSYRYFKVEPIIWRVISDSYNGKKLLLSEKVIDATKWYYYFDYNREMSWEWISEDQPSLYKRNFNGKDILPSNYKYSTIRAFLNGKYETGDQQPKNYENNGFLQKAFTKTAQDFIKEVQIDNSIASVRPTNYNNLSSRDKEDFYTATSWICDDVVDKVFLLSVNEMTNPEYGFKIYGDADWAKEILVTDYSKANNVEYQYGGSCDLSWLRSPRDGDNVFVFDNYIYFRYSYDIDLGGGYEYGSYGIAPALCIEP